jgi:hypothetical protein
MKNKLEKVVFIKKSDNSQIVSVRFDFEQKIVLVPSEDFPSSVKRLIPLGGRANFGIVDVDA